MNNKPSYLITSDETGAALGIEEKATCHAGDGIRHQAFLVMLRDGRNRLMLARRSDLKPLWPGFWDGTVAGHFAPGGDRDMALVRRVREETGLVCETPRHLLGFAYEARYGDVGTEKEYCDVYLADGIADAGVPLNPDEVAECRFVEIAEAERLVAARSLDFAPWFTMALEKCRRNGFL